MKAMKLTGAAILVTLLASCATPQMREISRDQTKATEEATQMRRIATNPAASGGDAYFAKRDTYWVGGGAESRIKAPTPLPPAFSEPVRFQRQYPVTLNYIAEYVTTNFGVPMVVTADAVQAAADTSFDPITLLQQRTGAGGMSGLPPLPALPGGGSGAAGATASAGSTTITIANFQGTLKQFLDLVAARSGNSWRFEHGGITLFGLDTRIFQVDVLPGQTTLGATVSNQAQGGAAAGGGGGSEGGSTSSMSSGNTTTMQANIAQFDAISSAVQGMLSPRGKAVPVPSMSQIAVTDVPLVLDRIERYVGDLNSIATKQVVLDVRLYAVDLRSDESYGIDWNIVWGSMGSNFGVDGLSPGTAPPTSSGSLNIGVINPASPFNGSSLLLSALSSQGNVSTITTAGVSTLSGKPAPVQLAEEFTYAASVSTNLVPNVGSTTTITPGTRTTGFSMVALPIVTRGDELLLQLQVNLSSLRELKTFSAGGSAVQQPNIDSRQLFQTVKLRSGQTLVLSGFEQERLMSNLTGVGSPKFMGLGGNRAAQRMRTVLVLTVTPRVSD